MYKEDGGIAAPGQRAIPRPNQPMPTGPARPPAGTQPRPNPMGGQKFTVPPPPPQGGHPVRRLRMWERAQRQADGTAKRPADAMNQGGKRQPVPNPAPGTTPPLGHSGPFIPPGGQPPVTRKGPVVGQPLGISADAPTEPGISIDNPVMTT